MSPNQAQSDFTVGQTHRKEEGVIKTPSSFVGVDGFEPPLVATSGKPCFSLLRKQEGPAVRMEH